MSAIDGEFTHFRHIKTRKVVILEIEIPEENFTHMMSVLGMPIGGQSKPVAIALLDNQIYNKPPVPVHPNIPQTEGDKLRVRAVMLAKDIQFQKCISSTAFNGVSYSYSEAGAVQFIYDQCKIESRSELSNSPEAQAKFKDLLTKYESWQLSQRYADNLNK